MPLTPGAIGLPDTHTVWFHNERVFVMDETPKGDRVIVVYYHEGQPDMNDPFLDQVIAHFRTAGMIHICEQGVVQYRGECYPYAVFC